jgi:hypothetical protein
MLQGGDFNRVAALVADLSMVRSLLTRTSSCSTMALAGPSVKEVKILNIGAETVAEPFAVAKEDAKD